MLQLDLLLYINTRKDFDTDGFKFNPYGACMDNKTINGETLTILFHVYDVKAIHKDTKVAKKFKQCIDFMYGDPNIRMVK